MKKILIILLLLPSALSAQFVHGDRGVFKDSIRVGDQWITPVKIIVWNAGTGGGGSSIWGAITGTLSDQTDLQNALNAKLDTGLIAGQAVDSGNLSDIIPPTNLSLGTATATTQPINNSNGTGITLPSATGTVAGLMSSSLFTKLSGIATGAEVNVQVDWNEANSGADDYIKNKPTIPTNNNQLTNGAGYLTSIPDLLINNQVGTTYTLVLTDKNKFVRLNNASAISVTVPPNSSVAFPIGSVIYIQQTGAGQVTMVAGAGVVINTASTLKTKDQYSNCVLIKVDTDTWSWSGRIE